MKYLYEELPEVQVAGRKVVGRVLFGLMVLANLAVIFYYLFRLSSASCRITKVASA